MADQPVPKSVLGKRRPFFMSFGLADGALLLGSPVILLVIAGWYVKTILGPGGLFDDHLGPAVVLLVPAVLCMGGTRVPVRLRAQHRDR